MLQLMGGGSSQFDARGLRVLFDLVHPANVLVFYHTIKRLQDGGADVHICSRHKDVLVALLDDFGFEHRPISRAGEGKFGLARELAQRDLRLWRIARKFRPHVMVGYGGVAISHVGKLTGIPSISFYDTEHAKLQIKLALPFITEWHVPESWRGPEAEGRTFSFPGGKQFAYLHPDQFSPSPEIAKDGGWDPTRDNFLVRTVAWKAAHDAGLSGVPIERVREVVALLAERGKVHISAEGALPGDLEPMRFRGAPSHFHHLLAHCRLYFSESVTIASEGVMLGVPGLLQVDRNLSVEKDYGYVAEQKAAGLISEIGPDGDAAGAIAAALAIDVDNYRARAREYVAGKGDLNRYIFDQILRVAETATARGARSA
jgi:predicted glycosyltransferase